MNAFAIFAVNEHLEFLLAEAAPNRSRSTRGRPSLATRLGGRQGPIERRRFDVRDRLDPPRARRLPVPELSLLPRSQPPPSKHENLRPPPPAGVFVCPAPDERAARALARLALEVGRDVDVAEGRALGIVEVPLGVGDTDRAEPVAAAPEAGARRTPAAPRRRDAPDRSGAPSGAVGRDRRTGGVAEQRRVHPSSSAATSRRAPPGRATACRQPRRGDVRVGRGETGRDTGERPLERPGVVGERGRRAGDPRACVRHGAGPTVTMTSAADARTASIACQSSGRPSMSRQLVATEPRRPATGEDDGGDPHRPTGWRGARGPGTWPSGVRRRTPRRSRSSRIAMTYLRLVPVASRNAAGVSGASAAAARARAVRSRYVVIA